MNHAQSINAVRPLQTVRAMQAQQAMQARSCWFELALLLILSLFFVMPAQAEESRGVLSGVETMVDETHDKISNRFSSFIVQIDDFIGAGTGEEQLNTSWARVRLDTVKPEDEKPKLAAKVKLRLVFPQSQKRFRLLVSTDDGNDTGANSDETQTAESEVGDSNGVALALRFIRTAKKQFSLNFDVGARYRYEKVQLFGRFNAAYRRSSAYGFTNELSNSFTHYSASGYENRVGLDSRRLIFGRESLYFRNSLSVDWQKGKKGAVIGETLGLYADINQRKALALEAISSYATALNGDELERFRGVKLRARFRHNIWRPWFFYEVWPSVSWPSSTEYEKAYGGLIRIEVVLGKVL